MLRFNSDLIFLAHLARHAGYNPLCNSKSLVVGMFASRNIRHKTVFKKRIIRIMCSKSGSIKCDNFSAPKGCSVF